jgi:hypothetical protein
MLPSLQLSLSHLLRQEYSQEGWLRHFGVIRCQMLC